MRYDFRDKDEKISREGTGYHWEGLANLKKRLDEMLPPAKYDGGEKVVRRPKPYVPPTAPDKKADWMDAEPGTHPFKPLKPPGR